MSKGLPSVAFDCATGPGEIITDGVDGRLVEPKNIEAFAEAICELIDDQDLRRKLGAAAQSTAAVYDLQAIGARWDTLLTETVRRRTRSGSR
jgi:glycosyltransferase involved in cell wall biosynthesis